VAFQASNPNQQAMMRDWRPALVSRQKNSVVLVRPASRQLQANGRPVFVVGINNLNRTPLEFRVSQMDANQRVGESEYPMVVVTFEIMQQEEKNRQIASAILVGMKAVMHQPGMLQADQVHLTAERHRKVATQLARSL
jgi:hypothetical protein